jgi:hypothetical protein
MTREHWYSGCCFWSRLDAKVSGRYIARRRLTLPLKCSCGIFMFLCLCVFWFNAFTLQHQHAQCERHDTGLTAKWQFITGAMFSRRFRQNNWLILVICNSCIINENCILFIFFYFFFVTASLGIFKLHILRHILKMSTLINVFIYFFRNITTYDFVIVSHAVGKSTVIIILSLVAKFDFYCLHEPIKILQIWCGLFFFWSGQDLVL